jgi:hypothetical protein
LTPDKHLLAKGPVASPLEIDNVEKRWLCGRKDSSDVLFQGLTKEHAVVVPALQTDGIVP